MPKSLRINSELFSSYKNHTTLKGLVGISPGGALTFISQLYTGYISDREIITRSGFLNLPFDKEDSVMADKGRVYRGGSSPPWSLPFWEIWDK